MIKKSYITRYLVVLIAVILNIYLTKSLINLTSSLDDLYTLNAYNFHSFGALSIILISILFVLGSILSFGYHVKKNVSKTSDKLKIFGLAWLILVFVCKMLLPSIYFFPLSLVLGLILILTDLYFDNKNNPLLWYCFWLVLVSLGTSALVFSLTNNKKEEVRQKLVENYNSKTPYNSLLKLHSKDPLRQGLLENLESEKTVKKQYQNTTLFVKKLRNDDVVYSSIGSPRLSKSITTFSLIFTHGVVLLILLLLLNQKFQFIPSWLHIPFNIKKSISQRIQVLFLILIILSFLGIAAVTVFFAKQINRNVNQEILQYKLQAMELDFYNTNESIIKNQESSFLNKIKETYDIEILNISILVSETKELPKVKLDKDSKLFALQNDRLFAKVDYKTLNKHEPFGIIELVASTLNVYVFLLIIAIVLAILFSKTIARPIETLSYRMNNLKLRKENQPVKWESDDELGELINNYNEMVSKLQSSANLMVQTERDMAWREMARQVAHEIKNPLTPMKLTIQYLQRQLTNGSYDAKENANRVSETLLQQIENLSNIADAFSNFAALPKASNEKVLLNDVVASVHDLFRKREDMDFQLSVPINDIIVFADKNHLVRILNNLVKNAFEAIPDRRRGVVSIELLKKGKYALVIIEDNGAGIPEEMKEKIFNPKFTSKSSGTGLGLGIASNMAEAFGGRIYFESKEGIGTQFYLEIPLMRLEDNYDNQNRVSLD